MWKFWVVFGVIYIAITVLGLIWGNKKDRERDRRLGVLRRPLTVRQKLAALRLLRQLQREREEEWQRFQEAYLRNHSERKPKTDWKKEGF